MAAWVRSVGASPRVRQRLLEIFPGALTWTVLLTPVVVAFAIRVYDPTKLWVLGLGAIALDLYWFFRTTVTVRAIRRSLRAIRQTEAQDWWQRCCDMEVPDGAPRPDEIVHCALIPTYTERYEVLRATVAALAQQNYPSHLRICAIITRTTDVGGIENVQRLRDEFGDCFRSFLHVLDPLLPGIVIGKSAAMSYAGPVLRAHCDELGLDPARTVVTDLDSDFRLHPQYFAHITHEYVRSQDRITSIWQPVPVFRNNLWRVPAAVRVMATAVTQWQMFLHQNPHRLTMFSSYSMPMALLSDVGYWDSDVIPEDSRFFWKSFFLYGERLSLKPCFITVDGDAPRSKDWGSTHVSQYNQIKRWAWGVTDIAYVTPRLLEHHEIPRRLRLRRYFVLVTNHLAWTTLPILLFLGGSLPALIDLDYSLSTAAQVIGSATSGILTLTLLNTIVLIAVDHAMCRKPVEWRWWRRRYSDLQLFLYPIVGVALSVIPALEAQTRLMFGAYIEYVVAAKE